MLVVDDVELLLVVDVVVVDDVDVVLSPLVVVVGGMVVGGRLVVGAPVDVVVLVDTQLQAPEQTSPGAHVNAPPGELGSHGSPGSTIPLPHVFAIVVVVVDADGGGVVGELVVGVGAGLHSGGYDANCGTVSRSVQSTLNSVTQSTH